MKYNSLSSEEQRVILQKGTERAGSGRFLHHKEDGVYICRQCDAPLYRSDSKFESHCGWPSFDDEIENAVKRTPDADGRRTEITCAHCGGHLGHVFSGEGMTPKNMRHCVNSVSLDFVPGGSLQKAIFASGCFWGTQYMFQSTPGVLATRVGYTGGTIASPTYQQVCGGNTGHVEALEVTFNGRKTTFETLAKLFFETHDFTQTDGQGPDIGSQYLSRIFYFDPDQKKCAEDLIDRLAKMGHSVATRLLPATTFFGGEDYHQNYYNKTGKQPYCHRLRKVF